ncbi:hypothetical protein GW17_00018098 [Ensete ventricosum]|nr:hypothetical protein GW17_00018098 [Ensete ventricosum]
MSQPNKVTHVRKVASVVGRLVASALPCRQPPAVRGVASWSARRVRFAMPPAALSARCVHSAMLLAMLSHCRPPAVRCTTDRSGFRIFQLTLPWPGRHSTYVRLGDTVTWPSDVTEMGVSCYGVGGPTIIGPPSGCQRQNGQKENTRAKKPSRLSSSPILPNPRFLEVCATEALAAKPNAQIFLPLLCLRVQDSEVEKDPVSFARTGDGRLLRFDGVGLGAQVRSVQGQDSRVRIEGDSCFQGGDVIETNEIITEGGDCPSLYQSARYGDFCYKFDSLVPGDYFVDLHFAEIVNTNGPKGIRVFNVFVQEEKARYKSLTFNIILQRCVVSERFLSVLELQILSGLDIYSVVGANKPLQLVDLRVSVVDDGNLLVSFEGLSGTPTVSGICIRKAPPLSDLVKPEHLTCSKCATEIEVSPLKVREQRFH